MGAKKQYITVTRRQILEAIREEPFAKHTGWVSRRLLVGVPSEVPGHSKRECTVCAVGGVLRRALGYTLEELAHPTNTAKAGRLTEACVYVAGATNVAHGSKFDACTNPKEALRARKYLTALSGKFEELCLDNDIPSVRKKLARWARTNMPEKMRVEINGFKNKDPLALV
jgi:hypothetical protein